MAGTVDTTASFDVSKFTSRIATDGLASPNKFQVNFGAIPGTTVGRGRISERGEAEQLSIMCDQASLAGRDVQSVLDLQYGIRRQVVYNAPAYTPLSLSFLCTENMKEKKALDAWNNLCVDISKGFTVEYYNKYVSDVTVHVLNRSGTAATYSMKYHEVYPKTVTAIELNHGTTNATLRVTTEMQYAYWTTDNISFEKFVG